MQIDNVNEFVYLGSLLTGTMTAAKKSNADWIKQWVQLLVLAL